MHEDQDLLDETEPALAAPAQWDPEEPEERGPSIWRGLLVAAAGLLLAVGGGYQIYAFARGERSKEVSASAAAGPQLLSPLVADPAPAGAASTAAADSEPAIEDAGDAHRFLREWSPSFARWGFSFFVGLAVGCALRAFYKIGLVVAGLLALILFGLSSIGVITVNWGVLEDEFNQMAASARDSFGQLQALLQGSLPSGAMAGLGLLSGLWRR